MTAYGVDRTDIGTVRVYKHRKRVCPCCTRKGVYKDRSFKKAARQKGKKLIDE